MLPFLPDNMSAVRFFHFDFQLKEQLAISFFALAGFIGIFLFATARTTPELHDVGTGGAGSYDDFIDAVTNYENYVASVSSEPPAGFETRIGKNGKIFLHRAVNTLCVLVIASSIARRGLLDSIESKVNLFKLRLRSVGRFELAPFFRYAMLSLVFFIALEHLAYVYAVLSGDEWKASVEYMRTEVRRGDGGGMGERAAGKSERGGERAGWRASEHERSAPRPPPPPLTPPSHSNSS
jgi:hypothetical protein